MLIGNTVLLGRRLNLNVLNELGSHALGDGGIGVSAYCFQEGIRIHPFIFRLFQLRPQRLKPPGVLALLLLIPRRGRRGRLMTLSAEFSVLHSAVL